MKNEGVLEYKEAQFLAAELVNVVAYLQKRYICHRDIKPGNILFDKNMHLKIIDFGSGKSYKDQTVQKAKPVENVQSGSGDEKEIKRMNTFTGTCEYMAPEIIKGEYVSNACDLWAIGIIIYKFFAEFSPFQGGFPEETLIKIQEEQIEFPESFPENAKDICQKLLEKDPSKRLGAGPEGSENDMFSLKSHPFFDGINFENLSTQKSPIPIPLKRISSLKERIIAKYREKSTVSKPEKPKEEVKSKPVVNTPKAPAVKEKLEDWKYEKDIKIIHKELIKVRTKMLILYKSVISLTTSEPAFYLYNLKNGALEQRFDLKEYKLKVKGKSQFKLVKKGESEYKRMNNKFKIISHKKAHRDSLNKRSIVVVLSDLALK